jgi:apolipoprotein N-acyltransferase
MAVVAGFFWAGAFPKIGIAGFAWLAPGLMIFAARDQSGGKAFRCGYVAGIVFWLASLYWLLLIPYRWHGIPFGPALGWLALSAFLALYPATWVWLGQKLQTSNVKNQTSTWLSRTVFALECAILWVALEMIQTRFLSGFPWDLLGVSQYKLTPLIQIASLTGVYGVSFLVVWFSVSLLNCFTILVQRPAQRMFVAEIAFPMLAVGAIWIWGFQRIAPAPTSEREIKLALIQPSIPQEVIWDRDAHAFRFEKLMKLSEEALAEKPDGLVWPEASMPGFTAANMSAMTNLIASNNVSFIFGADDAEFRPDSTNFFNSAFLFSHDGNYLATYRKRKLVMFGEYVPLERWLPFLKWVTPVEGGFTPGEKPVQFEMDGDSQPSTINYQPVKTSVLICFEDVFPHEAREHVEDETDFLLNLTNDGWFGRGAAQWQQAFTALFRAVENGVPLVRCTNNGLTCWIDQFGRLREVFGAESENVYGPGFLIVKIPVGGSRLHTFYNRHGDIFGWSCVIVAGGIAAQTLLRKRFPLPARS